jgi:hypothetical protein
MQLVNGDGKKILGSYYSIFSLGMHFIQEGEIWDPTTADISRLTYDVFVRKCPTLPENNRKLINDELETSIMKNPNFHRIAQ